MGCFGVKFGVKPDIRRCQPSVTIQQPKISVFTREVHVGKVDTDYDMWRYGVKCLMAVTIYSLDFISQAVRCSLRGDAGKIAMYLRLLADLNKILHKPDNVYGAVKLNESLLAKFYSARQRQGKEASDWSCRLEGIITHAIHEGEVES